MKRRAIHHGVLGISACALAAGLTSPAHAQQGAGEDVILVLDASGSMWGQIDGENKIVIARNVIGQMLDELPDERRLGLIAYGHNREGDCTDIEQIAEVGADRETIRAAVNALNPKGKTPLSASVRQAAEALTYTENRATVILVSDGEETCDLDPCVVGQELEAAGVDFTAHVIGFDIADVRLRGQLQCLADNTGGAYWNAGNADELASALSQTVTAAPEPERVTLADLRATELAGGPEIDAGLTWRVTPAGQDEVAFEASNAGRVETELAPGFYDVTVERPADGLKGEARNVQIVEGAERTITIALEYALDASVQPSPEGQAPAGGEVAVAWTGPGRENDWITVVRPDSSQGSYNTGYEYVRNGNPVVITMPVEPGEYEVRYVLGRPTRVLARAPITVTPVEATLSAAQTVQAGANFAVNWTGPGGDNDWITVVAPDANERSYTSYDYTRNGDELELQAPLEAGEYELRYVQSGQKVLARAPITVTPVEATLSAAQTVQAGANFAVNWTGPGGDNDWITVVAPDANERSYTSYDYTRNGDELELQAPLEAGEYELRYVQSGQKVLARAPITVTPVEATLSGPTIAMAGTHHDIAWTGPGAQHDWITVVRPDDGERTYTDYEVLRDDDPVSLRLPLEAGEYEFRYVQDGQKVLARQAVTITPAEASLEAPETASVGDAVDVSWQGPGAHGDWITIVEPDARENSYTDYAIVRGGDNPVEIELPVEPGAYEFRYVLDGKKVIARRSVTVEDVTAALEAPASVVAGERFMVDWDGPGHHRDYITITEPDANDRRYMSYRYTRQGDPANLDAPAEPGVYELRYVLAGERVVARRSITVTAE